MYSVSLGLHTTNASRKDVPLRLSRTTEPWGSTRMTRFLIHQRTMGMRR